VLDGTEAPKGAGFASEEQAQATRLYDAALGRAPDAGGLVYWTGALEAGVPLKAVAEAFIAAPEFQAAYGAPGDREFIGLLYGNVLGREGDPGGLERWTGLLEDGAADRGDIVLAFSECSEHAAMIAAQDYLP
jgi:Domain of unknown function (DUF4214)